MKAGSLHAAWRNLPLAPLPDIVPGTALILAPHADDESLGCGGLIAACCQAGRPPVVVIVTDGAASHPHSRQWPATRLRQQRRQEVLHAVACLGLGPERVVFLNQPDAATAHEGPVFDRIVQELASLAVRHGCTTVFAPSRLDPHCDHEAVWKMGLALHRCHALPLLTYPVWGWLVAAETDLDHGPPVGMRLDITPYRALKARAVSAHESQYGGLITDDPTGFSLPASLLAALVTDFEVFLAP
ncbi:PIG-L family deacetylase [Komagataeibacter sp. AV436]|uniref:PIG-L family deacetylase n=1 Tax=Komagataeibacter melomenusus TaxID=2766578 RepID=A0ABX2A9L6_9PROT|nr:PIG-L family deacetylase [Komagataeibacter melomenusus]MBV1829685.1 PIG-L family deacetylase [Komagataeibacter melomenusus]NPC65114.1 PIG-L family deacetylase [Komagataeibacter melomenusus]